MFIFFPKDTETKVVRAKIQEMKISMKHHANGKLFDMSTKQLIVHLHNAGIYDIDEIPLLECLDSQLIKKIEEMI